MKNILILAALALSLTASAQTSTKQEKPALVINESTKTIDLDATEVAQTQKATGYTASYKGQTYPVYESAKGKLFIYMKSKKTGKEYKKYLN